MRFQLLLLGAIAALTVGAVSLAGSVSTASLSADRSSASSPSREATETPAVALVTAPTIPAVVVPDSATTTEIAPAQSAAEPAPDPSTIPAACTAAFELVRAAKVQRPVTESAIRAAFAKCISQLPNGSELQPQLLVPGPGVSGEHRGDGSGD